MQTIAFSRGVTALPVPATVPATADAIAFESGLACPDLLPDLGEIAAEAASRRRSETLQYGPRPGLPDLRGWIAQYMKEDGVPNSAAERVLVVNGAKQGLELLCRLLLDEGDSIVVTAPTYFTAIPIFRSFGARLIQIAQDNDGLVVDELKDRLDHLSSRGGSMPKFVYDVPDFHNPTGVTMSYARRKALLEICAQRNIMIVEDSPYRKIRFEGDSLPSLKALDTADIVLALGTFSKLVAPGLRVGWISATPEIVKRLAQIKADAGSCPLTQRIITEFCKSGRLGNHVANVRRAYGEHRDRMVAALRRSIDGISFSIPTGGYYLWIKLPEYIDADDLERRAHDEGVAVLSGTRFFASSEVMNNAAPSRYVRLAYSFATLEQIDEGVERLARAFKAIVRDS